MNRSSTQPNAITLESGADGVRGFLCFPSVTYCTGVFRVEMRARLVASMNDSSTIWCDGEPRISRSAGLRLTLRHQKAKVVEHQKPS